ncbi:MAG: hypothetical protein F2817_10875, partial [Actinobacteria bacterium]|nr:hypothetical protein [Actinomycetota bacterium]
MSQQPSTSIPLRRFLLGAAVLYLLVAMLPWYRIEGRGFVVEFSGLHELGVLVGILAAYVAIWEIVRLTGVLPLDEDRGDRYSAVGGLTFGATGAVFVLQRLSEGSLAYGWLIGAVLITGVTAASVLLFSVADGPEALATFVGLRDRGDDEEPPRTPTTSARPRPRTPTAVELAAPGADRPSGDGSPGATWTGSPYARGAYASGGGRGGEAGGSPGGERGTGVARAPGASRAPTAGGASPVGRSPAGTAAAGPASAGPAPVGPGPAGIPTGERRRRSGR